MAITRAFAQGGQFRLEDWTPAILNVPNQFGLIGQLGLFEEEGVSQNTVTFEEINRTGGTIIDRVRGERNTVSNGDVRKLHSLPIPHFPLDDSINPADIQGVRAYAQPDAPETEELVRARKIESLALKHDQTLEIARAQLLTTGNFYAPSGTIGGNIFSEFGVTQKSVDFTLGTTTSDVIAKQEEGIAHILDNANGATIGSMVVLASPEFFAKYIAHANVKAAYSQYSSSQEPLRNRLGGATSFRREFVHGSLRLIEMRDVVTGNRLIPANEAVLLPLGTTDVFKTYFAPAFRRSFANTIGERRYVFSKDDGNDIAELLQSESNFLNMVNRPQLVVKFTTSN